MSIEPSSSEPLRSVRAADGPWVAVAFAPEDLAWFEWISTQLKAYRVPTELVGQKTRHGYPLPETFTQYPEPDAPFNHSRYAEKLANAGCLLVICSPGWATCRWIENQITEFAREGSGERIVALVVECSPEPKSGETVPIGNDWMPMGLCSRIGDDGRFLPVEPDEPVIVDGRLLTSSLVRLRKELLAAIAGISSDEFERIGGLQSATQKSAPVESNQPAETPPVALPQLEPKSEAPAPVESVPVTPPAPAASKEGETKEESPKQIPPETVTAAGATVQAAEGKSSEVKESAPPVPVEDKKEEAPKVEKAVNEPKAEAKKAKKAKKAKDKAELKATKPEAKPEAEAKSQNETKVIAEAKGPASVRSLPVSPVSFPPAPLMTRMKAVLSSAGLIAVCSALFWMPRQPEPRRTEVHPAQGSEIAVTQKATPMPELIPVQSPLIPDPAAPDGSVPPPSPSAPPVEIPQVDPPAVAEAAPEPEQPEQPGQPGQPESEMPASPATPADEFMRLKELGDKMLQIGNREGALSQFQRALRGVQIDEKGMPEAGIDPREVARVCLQLGVLEAESSSTAEAKRTITMGRKALGAQTKGKGTNDPERAQILDDLNSLQRRLERESE